MTGEDDETYTEDFDAEEHVEELLVDAKETIRKQRNARAYEIRRHLEDLQEKRRFQALFDDLD